MSFKEVKYDPLSWFLTLLVILLVLGMLFGPLIAAKAHEHGEVRGYHNQHHHSQLHHWYEGLMRPDHPAWSCCNKNDCTPTQAKLVEGRWHALKAGRWIAIPNAKINAEESLDSQAHICYTPGSITNDDVLCFVKPGSGI